MNAFLIIVSIIALVIGAGIFAWRITVMPEVDFMVNLIMESASNIQYLSGIPRRVSREAVSIRVRHNASRHADCKVTYGTNSIKSMQDGLRLYESADVPSPLSVRQVNYDAYVQDCIDSNITLDDWIYTYIISRSKKHWRKSLKGACQHTHTNIEVALLLHVILTYGGDRFDICTGDNAKRLANIQNRRIANDLRLLVYSHRSVFEETYTNELQSFRRDQNAAFEAYLRQSHDTGANNNLML